MAATVPGSNTVSIFTKLGKRLQVLLQPSVSTAIQADTTSHPDFALEARPHAGGLTQPDNTPPAVIIQQPASSTASEATQVMQQAIQHQVTAADLHTANQVLAAQAAELVSARQAMQLLAQLLEQGSGPEPALSQPVPALEQTSQAVTAGSMLQLMRQLVEQLSAPPSVTVLPSEVNADQQDLMAAQAAELASAREAMQLMAQLLESGGTLSSQQPMEGVQAAFSLSPDAYASTAQELAAGATEHRMQQALQGISAVLERHSTDRPVHASTQVCIQLIRSC